jgi:hypothetical protein
VNRIPRMVVAMQMTVRAIHTPVLLITSPVP